MMWGALVVVGVVAQLLGTREVINKELAEGQMMRVRYNLTNQFEFPIFNVTLLDPSFNRQEFVFIEGKSKAKLTYGTMKPGAWAHVDLDLEPRKAFELTLVKAKVTYDLKDETTEMIELFEEGQVLTFQSARAFNVRNMEYLQILAGIIVLGVLPIVYSNTLKKQRVKIYKSS